MARSAVAASGLTWSKLAAMWDERISSCSHQDDRISSCSQLQWDDRVSSCSQLDDRISSYSQLDDKISYYSQWDDMIKVGSCVGWQDQQWQPAAVPLENHSRTVKISSIHLHTQSVWLATLKLAIRIFSVVIDAIWSSYVLAIWLVNVSVGLGGNWTWVAYKKPPLLFKRVRVLKWAIASSLVAVIGMQ